MKSQNLAIYLLRDGTTLDNSILNDSVGAEYIEVEVRDDANFNVEHVCYMHQAKPKPAKWVQWLATVFDFGGNAPQNQSSGCVVVVKAEDRLFALTFGMGRHALDLSRIEYDFGLRVALNKVHPDKVRQLVSKTVDIRTREKSTYHHAGGGVGDFAMDLDVEWLRSIAGTAASKTEFTTVAGTDAIRLQNCKKQLSDIVSLCTGLLKAYQEAVPEVFSFVENVRPVGAKDSLHLELEAALTAKADSGNRDGLEVIADWSTIDKMGSARLFFGHNEYALPDLSGDAVWKAADALLDAKKDLVVSKIKLDILDAVGEQIKRGLLIDLVQVELVHNGKTYLRLERRWFEVADDYIKQVNQRVQDLPDLTDDLDLPDWDKATHPEELDYNTDVANAKGWMLQDKQLIYPPGSGGASFEPCDILTEEAHWIHVKEGVSSSCLNHLFGQISASAELFARNEYSRTKMHARYCTKWASTPLQNRRSTFVAAIGRPNVKADLLGRMLVAKINLLDHARRVRALDYEFAVVGFKVIPDPSKTKKRATAPRKGPPKAKRTAKANGPTPR